MMINGKFQPYILLKLFLTKTNDFLTTWKTTNSFNIWKHLLNPIWVTEALNMPQNGPHMVLNGKFSQSTAQARASGGVIYPLFLIQSVTKPFNRVTNQPTHQQIEEQN